jgi:hypothetical protein
MAAAGGVAVDAGGSLVDKSRGDVGKLGGGENFRERKKPLTLFFFLLIFLERKNADS